jgi:hypothetical protein
VPKIYIYILGMEVTLQISRIIIENLQHLHIFYINRCLMESYRTIWSMGPQIELRELIFGVNRLTQAIFQN